MTQLSLLLAWKLSVYLAPCLKLELSTWGINLAGSLNRCLPSHTSWTQHTYVCNRLNRAVQLSENLDIKAFDQVKAFFPLEAHTYIYIYMCMYLWYLF